MPIISVIVPVYKAEVHLNKCVDSILAQTFSDFELILVDDGSPDNCPKICDQYMERDSRIKVLHQKNLGVSAARNAGIFLSQGDYLVFVDSDDYVHQEYLQKLYKGYTLDVDISIVGYNTIFNSQTKTIPCTDIKLPLEFVGSIKADFRSIIGNGLLHSPWNKMFKTKLIKDNRIHFNESMKLGEDLCFNIAYFYYCERYYLYNMPLYYYIKANSALSRNISINYFQIEKVLYQTISEFIKLKQVNYNLQDHIIDLLMDTLGTLSINKNEENKELIYEKMNEILQDDITRNYISRLPDAKFRSVALYFLLKSRSKLLIINFFRIKHRMRLIFSI